MEVQSAGLNRDSEVHVTPELLNWADMIFVMEKSHRKRLLSSFGEIVSGRRIICLDIPDKYRYMDPELLRILDEKIEKHI